MTTIKFCCVTLPFVVDDRSRHFLKGYKMNTAVNTEIKNDSDLAKNRTLKALFQVICADNEFTLLRHTLELYCEEIEANNADFASSI